MRLHLQKTMKILRSALAVARARVWFFDLLMGIFWLLSSCIDADCSAENCGGLFTVIFCWKCMHQDSGKQFIWMGWQMKNHTLAGRLFFWGCRVVNWNYVLHFTLHYLLKMQWHLQKDNANTSYLEMWTEKDLWCFPWIFWQLVVTLRMALCSVEMYSQNIAIILH